MKDKTYIGDSVYVVIDQLGCVVLTTENGFGPSNTIVLEPEVLGALLGYLKQGGLISVREGA